MFIKWRQRRGATCSDSYRQNLLKEPSALYLLAATEAGHFRNPGGFVGGVRVGKNWPLPLPATPLSLVISPLALNFKVPERK